MSRSFSSGGSSTTSETNLSFYVRIDPLEPNYSAHPVRHGEHNYWAPPNVISGYNRRQGHLFRWVGGNMTSVAPNDHVRRSLHWTHSTATIFTQNPDTPHLLVVPFDAQTTHAYLNNGGWRPLVFHHIPKDNTGSTYSAVSAIGDRQHIAAPGFSHWMPQLLPGVYDYQTGPHRTQAGLIGSLPILIALAAFSAPPDALTEVMTRSVRPRSWQPHRYHYPEGHIPERGMVVTIFFDPLNPQGSTPALLNNLQGGHFGPFYN